MEKWQNIENDKIYRFLLISTNNKIPKTLKISYGHN